MYDLLVISYRTVLLYVLILIILRIMGKREVGELGVIDVVVFVIMAEVAAFALDSPDKKLIQSIVPMIILLVIQYASSFLSLKSKNFRDIVDGGPALIIRHGIIMEEEMRRQRYNLDDLFQQLREQQVGSIHEVSFAYLEPSGNLSVFKHDSVQPVLALISDGVIQGKHVKMIGKTEKWLETELRKMGISDPSHIFYCSYENGSLQYQLKEQHQ
ncbi:hypothetical membrane associated protein [Bacillus sp. OxB-1]|uniref:DUF421 domain-containing protein n=1 Tax=Bacillus sp. (strain OxB-1) TaxID=98228 RepID=UPI000581E83A|nr:DUF421 domain-containing protein [Bacillus sp. OxB-1]BAQ11554.1 hypothetical membrane associated protein [Bacillus sp. OxB-1]